MNKFTKTIAGVVSALALVAVVATSASAATFTRSLTVGSRGADVTTLQTWLNSKGYLAASPTGYFGALTKAAVAAFQTANGVTPAAGYFGPLTQAKWEAVAAGSMGGSMSSVPGCATGAMFSSTTGASCSTGSSNGGSMTSDNTDGSVTVTRSPYVTTSQTLKKGDVKDIYAVKFQATSGKVTVNRFDVHFTIRPWLVFSKLTLKDSNGTVVATKTLSSADDATEVTAGSDYLVRFDNVNKVVSPDVDVILVVNASVQSASDKITGQTVSVTVPDGSIRTINGKGYTDSLGVSGTNSIILSSTGSVADLYSRIDPSTPDTRNETVSTTNTTESKTLGAFGVKVQNRGGVVNSLSINLANNKGFDNTTLFQNVRLVDGSTTYGATSLSSGGIAAFDNLTINLTQDSWKTLKVVADVLATSTSFSASSTLDVSTIVGTDDNYATITLTNASDVASNDVTFVPNGGITISGITSVKGSVTTPTSGTWLAAYPSLGFTVTNNGNNPIYLSKTAGTALATTTSSGPNASTTVTSTVASGSTTGDISTAYIVNVGASRTFTYNFTVDNTNGTTAAKKLSITQINYGTSSGSPATLNVNFGLENLYVQIP